MMLTAVLLRTQKQGIALPSPSMLRRTAIKCHEKRGHGLGSETTEKKARKKKARRLSHQEVVIMPQLVLLGVDGAEYPDQLRRFLFLAMSVVRCCIMSDWLELIPP
ncbi:hypothetical protein NDU88_006178 [Pleurodeles waltl]|uniref:Uncharacterized protein n=1 Tax=Pleurodeles waltl TaxID=8319 RepID=A0AAV7TE31_PLEWA|nr:hypothetical protein NDU88_006178 [Pleurodeles waltl]